MSSNSVEHIKSVCAEASRLASSATPGPWYSDDSGWPVRSYRQDAGEGYVPVWCPDEDVPSDDPYYPMGVDFPTLGLIIASRSLVPQLAAAVVTLAEALEMEQTIAGMSNRPGDEQRIGRALTCAAAAMEASDE